MQDDPPTGRENPLLAAHPILPGDAPADGRDLPPPAAGAPASAPPTPAEKLGIAQHAAISSFWFAVSLHWGALGMIIVPSQATRMAGAVGLTEGEISGWTIGLGAVVGAVVPPVVGVISDRCRHPWGRRRPFVAVGTAINVVALLLFYLAFSRQSLAGYILAWMLIGLGNNVATGAFSGIIPDVVPPGERGLASSWMATMQQLGTIGGFVVGGRLMSTGREQDLAAIAIVTMVLGVVGAITCLGTPERPLTAARPVAWRELARCFWIDPRRYPDFGWVWLTRAFYTTGWWLVQPVLLYFLRDVARARDPAGAVSLLGSIVLLGAIPAGIAGGVLSDRIGRKRIVFLAALVMTGAALGFTLLQCLPVQWRLPAVYAIAIAWGFGYGAYLSVDWALATDVLPSREDAAKDMGVWHLSMVVPQSIAAPAAGLLLKPFSLGGGVGYRAEGYTLLFLLAAVFMFLCGALVFRIRTAR